MGDTIHKVVLPLPRNREAGLQLIDGIHDGLHFAGVGSNTQLMNAERICLQLLEFLDEQPKRQDQTLLDRQPQEQPGKRN